MTAYEKSKFLYMEIATNGIMMMKDMVLKNSKPDHAFVFFGKIETYQLI